VHAMQIELIGCTGAGKSTLAEGMLLASRRQGIDMLMGDTFVLKQHRLDWISSKPARTLLIDLFSLWTCLVTWRRNSEFYTFALRIIFRLPVGWLEKLNLARNVLKKIGIYEIIRRHGRDRQIILVDEGTLHAAHNLFVHVSVRPNADDLATFVRLVPRPEWAIYVMHSESVLIERTLQRGHKRIPDRSYANVELFVKRAVEIFDGLRRQPELEGRLLAIDRQQDLIVSSHDPGDPFLADILSIIRAGMETDLVNNAARPGLRQDAAVSV